MKTKHSIKQSNKRPLATANLVAKLRLDSAMDHGRPTTESSRTHGGHDPPSSAKPSFATFFIFGQTQPKNANSTSKIDFNTSKINSNVSNLIF